jgi:Domain of unknown function DUF29
MDFASLYEEDMETWAELQVAALRRLAETKGPWSNVIDWENVIEEINDFSSDRHAAQSLLRNAFVHWLKICGDPESLSVRRWRIDATDFLKQAQARLKPAMRARIDLDRVWLNAMQAAANALAEFERELPASVPRSCPFTFDEIVEMDPESDLKLILSSEDRR